MHIWLWVYLGGFLYSEVLLLAGAKLGKNTFLFVLFALLLFSLSEVFAVNQSVQNLTTDDCMIKTLKTFSQTELPNLYAFDAIAVNNWGRTFLGADSDGNGGIIFLTATTDTGIDNWIKVGPLLNGKYAAVRSISTNPEKQGEAIAEVHTYGNENNAYLFYTFGNGNTWAQAKEFDELKAADGLRRTKFVKYDSLTEPIILSTFTGLNKIYKWSGVPPLMTLTEYTTITNVSGIRGIVSFEDGNVFAIGDKLGKPAIYRATSSDLKNWVETNIPSTLSGYVTNLVKAQDGGLLAFYATYYKDGNVLRSEDNGNTWILLNKSTLASNNGDGFTSVVVSSRVGTIATYPSGKIYRLKSSGENASNVDMFGEVPFTSAIGYTLIDSAKNIDGYFYNVYGRELRQLSCNSQPILEDQTLTGVIGSPVVLNGLLAKDPDGDNLSYHWMLDTGPQEDLVVSENSAVTTFTPQKEGQYVWMLFLNDDGTPWLTYRPHAFFRVNVTAAENTPSTVEPNTFEPGVFAVNAGPDKTCTVGSECKLTGTVNLGDLPLARVQWIKLSGPYLFFENGHQETITFIPTVAGTFNMKFSAQDSHNKSVTDTMVLTIIESEVQPQENISNNDNIDDGTNPSSNPSSSIDSNNKAPIIDVESNISGEAMLPVTIDVLAIDPEQSSVTIEWEQTMGPEINFIVDDDGSLVFVPTSVGTYEFEVKAKDIQGNHSVPKTVSVKISENVADSNKPFFGPTWMNDQMGSFNLLIIGIIGIIIVIILVIGAIIIFVLKALLFQKSNKKKTKKNEN